MEEELKDLLEELKVARELAADLRRDNERVKRKLREALADLEETRLVLADQLARVKAANATNEPA